MRKGRACNVQLIKPPRPLEEKTNNKTQSIEHRLKNTNEILNKIITINDNNIKRAALEVWIEELESG